MYAIPKINYILFFIAKLSRMIAHINNVVTWYAFVIKTCLKKVVIILYNQMYTKIVDVH